MTTTADIQSVTTSDGTQLALYWQGSRDAPLTLVFAHGWTLDSRTWGPVTELLTAGRQDLRVLRYDHRGHGRSASARPGTSTIAQLADDLAELLHSAVAGPVVLGGHSLGGMAIMGLAQRHPELVAQRVAGVVFVATSCGDLTPLDFGPRPALARLMARGERRLMRAPLLARQLRDRPMTAARPALIRAGVRWLLFGAHPRRADVDLATQCMAQGRPVNILDFRPTFDDHDARAALAAFRNAPTRSPPGSATWSA